MSTLRDFKEWQRLVRNECVKQRWTKALIRTIDWETWRQEFFDDGLSPEEAVETEMDSMFENSI